MKKELTKTLADAAKNPAAMFAAGAMCGMLVSLCVFPFVKGVSVFSNNGNHNGNENQMDSTQADKKMKCACKNSKKRGNQDE